MARLTQWLMALAGLLTSASISSCSAGNGNEEPRPPVDTEQSVEKPVKDMIVDRLPPADDASNDVRRAYADAMQDDLDWATFDALQKLRIVDDNNDVSKVPGAYYGMPPAYKSNDTRKKKLKADRITIKLLPPDVSGSLDKRPVQKVVRSHFSEVRACLDNEFERNKKMGSGKVTVSWKVDETGAASGVTIKETTLKNKRVEDCLVEAISRWRFPKPTGGVWAHIEYSFDFELQTDD